MKKKINYYQIQIIIIHFKEDLIKERKNLTNKIKTAIDKGKIIDKEWNENNLSSLINDCIKIENNIEEINMINNNIINYKLYFK